jgi:uncharacterized protein YcbK (DUF882 family)
MKVKNFKHGKYFRLEEFLRSTTAQKLNIKLEPNAEQLENIENLIYFCLDPLRTYYGKAIIITSGFRCPLVNSKVGGANNSQHLTGCAADIKVNGCSANTLFEYIRGSGIPYDQLINEHDEWVHVSFRKGHNRHQSFRL